MVVKYNDAKGDYQVTLRSPDGKYTLKGIRLSPYQRSRLSVDSDRAITETARAALSFCDGLEDGRCARAVDPGSYADYSRKGTGYTVTRCRPRGRR
jgi:hypothetical protein